MDLLSQETREQLHVAHRVGAVGLEIVLSTAVGWFGGGWLDAQLGTGPWLQYFGLLCGVIAGFRGLYYVARFARSQEEEVVS